MNQYNARQEKGWYGGWLVNQEVQRISKKRVRAAMKKMRRFSLGASRMDKDKVREASSRWFGHVQIEEK